LRKLHNEQLQRVFQSRNIVRGSAKRRLSLAGHAWRKQGALVKQVIEENPMGKRPLRRPKLRWEDGVKREVESSLVPNGEKQRKTGISGKAVWS